MLGGYCPRPGPAGWVQSVLTLDVNGDCSLLPSGDGFVGGSAHDTLPILHIARGDEEGAHNALTLAISKQGLGGWWAGKEGHMSLGWDALDWWGKMCSSLTEEERALRSGHPGLQKEKETRRFLSCGKISLDLYTPKHKRNQAGPKGNQATGLLWYLGGASGSAGSTEMCPAVDGAVAAEAVTSLVDGGAWG